MASEERQRTGRGNRARDLIRLLSKNDGEASLEVEVDVAVEEPRARVVGGEADGDVVAVAADAHDVTLGRVHVVVRGLAGRADNVERVLSIEYAVSDMSTCLSNEGTYTVQVEGVGGTGGVGRVHGEGNLDRRV